MRHTLFPSVHPSEPVLEWDHVCVQRGNPPKVRRNSRRTDPLLVFAAVKKMAPSSREAIGPEVPDECFFLFRRHAGQWSRSSRCMLCHE